MKTNGILNAASNKAPRVLLPFDVREAVTVQQAADIAGRSPITVRGWAALHDLGRRVGGRWMVSRIALAMYLDSNRNALKAYLAGDRESQVVTDYFRRFGLEPQKNLRIGTMETIRNDEND